MPVVSRILDVKRYSVMIRIKEISALFVRERSLVAWIETTH